MKIQHDAIPEPIVIDEWSKRTTTELCGDEAQGLRCMLRKGHDDLHECLATRGPVRWGASPEIVRSRSER